MQQSTVRADAKVGRRRRKEKEKSDLFSLSFGAATKVITLVL